MSKTKDGHYQVAMHNNLICHEISTKENKTIQKSIYRMGITERRLLLYIIAHNIKDHCSDEDIPDYYEINVKEVMSFIAPKDGMAPKKMHSEFYNQVQDAIWTLMCTGIEYKDPRDNHTVMTTWLSAGHYWEGEGRIKVGISKELKPVLTGLTREYTLLDLVTCGRLRSAYAIRLYEYLKSVEKLKEVIVEIDELRKILQIPDGRHPRFCDLKKDVLTTAIEEINANTDIEIEHENGNESGRKWTHIRFKIKRNMNTTHRIPRLSDSEEENMETAECFKEICLANGFKLDMN